MTPEELAKLQKSVAGATDLLREKTEKLGSEHAEVKELIEKTAGDMEKYDEANQKLVASIEQDRIDAEDAKARIDELEVALARKSEKDSNWKESAEHKAWAHMIRTGEVEAKTLRTDDQTRGGYLSVPEFVQDVLRQVTEISGVRGVSRVRTVGNKVVDIPKRTGIPTATWEGETAEGDESESSYGTEQLTCHRQDTTVPITRDLLMDAAFDMEAEISQDVSEAFAQGEGAAFVSGDGAKKPQGFLAHPSIIAGAVETIGSGVVSGDDLILLTGELKVGYNPLYGFNRQTLAFLRTLKGSDGHYLWQMGLAPDAPATIAGRPYAVFQDMPAYGTTGNLSVIYGDFARGYQIVDRTGLSVIRDEFTRKKEAIVELTFQRWLDGQVVLPEAFVALKTKA